ncbi:DUF3800 domain-containing protein [Corynebacterium aurimucosum]
MNIYIDDSGCGGFKFGQGSSVHLVFAAIIFDDPAALGDLSQKIGEVKKRFNYQGEIKFNKSKDVVRCSLLEAVGQSKCRIRMISADKRYIYRENLRNSPPALKSFLIRMLLSKHHGTISDAKVFIDGKDTKGFSTEKSDEDYFMRMCNRDFPDTAVAIRFVDSKANLGIQVADLVAGALRAQLDLGKSEFFTLVEPKTWHRAGGTNWDFTRRESEKDIAAGSYVQPWKIEAAHTA